MNKRLLAILLCLLSLSSFEASASHIVGGEVTYIYLGDTIIGGILNNEYQISLSIYEDCLNGLPGAIAQDNPAFISIYVNSSASNYPLVAQDSIFYATSVSVPANFSNACVNNIPPVCLLKKTFIQTYYLPPNPFGYVFSYQRCCRNAEVINVAQPGQNGCTYYCNIPPSPYTNTSAVFKYYPPEIICFNNPLYYDNSATDADGDSLSYGFCSGLISPDSINNSNFILPGFPPPFDSVTYIYPFSSQNPISAYPALQINPTTGLITGTPNLIGRYLVNVYCDEWRHGVLINTIKREFQFVVTDCSKVVVANIPQYSTDFNTYIVDCKNYTVHFVNTSTGGFNWHWDFGVANAPGDTSSEFEPTFTYPDTGTYSVKLTVNPGSSCPDSITRFVKIYPVFYANFSDSGMQCPGDLIKFTDLSQSTLKPITYWKWYFGDNDSILTENPTHSYAYGGTYNVILISQNIKDCVDTAVKQLVIEDFKPFAGDDTTIVKGSSILFDAIGGISYTWSPATNLSDSAIFDPVGNYPDTGLFSYDVHVASEYGCSGDDSIFVHVVEQASFFVPNAFSPNGDGHNDYFKPIAIGYQGLKYFKVFNRYGQLVYNNNSLEVGWDGNYNNKECDIGTYFWEISFTDRFGKDGFLKGDVTLIR